MFLVVDYKSAIWKNENLKRKNGYLKHTRIVFNNQAYIAKLGGGGYLKDQSLAEVYFYYTYKDHPVFKKYFVPIIDSGVVEWKGIGYTYVIQPMVKLSRRKIPELPCDLHSFLGENDIYDYDVQYNHNCAYTKDGHFVIYDYGLNKFSD